VKKFIYVKEWKWLDPIGAQMHGGKPETGRVYATEYDVRTGNRMLLGNILLDRMVVTDEISRVFAYEIVELSPQNIIELNVKEEDLDMIIKVGQKPVEDTLKQKIKSELARIDNDKNDKLNNVVKALNNMIMTNTTAFELMEELVELMNDWDMETHSSPALSLALSTDGKGINIQQTMIEVEKYMKPVKQGGDDRKQILNAIVFLFTELQRRELNGLD
jgi:hypothetical protein